MTTTTPADASLTPPAETPYPPARVGWTAVVVLFFFTVLSVLDRNLLTLLVGPVKADLGVSDVQLGLLYGLAFAFFYAVAGLPAGWMIDRFERRLVIFWGVMVWSFATLMTGFSRGYASLFGARALVGAGEAVLVPGSHSMIADLFPREKLATPISVSAMGIKVGQGLALLIGGGLTALFDPHATYTLPLVGDMRGWHLIFLVVGAPGMLAAFLIFLIPEPARRLPPQRKAGEAGFGVYFQFVRRNLRFYIGHHLGVLVYGVTALSIITWAPAWLSRVHGWSESQIGLWLGTSLLIGTCAGIPLHGLIADKLFARGVHDIHMRYTAISAIVGLPIAFAIFNVSDPRLSVALIGLLLFVISTYVGLAVAAVQTVVPGDLRGKASAVMLLVIGMGAQILGPLGVALLTDHWFGDPKKVGSAILTCLMIGLPLTTAILSLTLSPMRRMVAEAKAW